MGFTYLARDPKCSWFHKQTKTRIYVLNIYISPFISLVNNVLVIISNHVTKMVTKKKGNYS